MNASELRFKFLSDAGYLQKDNLLPCHSELQRIEDAVSYIAGGYLPRIKNDDAPLPDIV